jgi:hypothetical protein
VSSMLNELDTRTKAVGILGARKLRMLEAEGLVVTERRRLEALESLYAGVKDVHRQRLQGVYPESVDDAWMWNAFDELEAIEHGQADD